MPRKVKEEVMKVDAEVEEEERQPEEREEANEEATEEATAVKMALRAAPQALPDSSTVTLVDFALPEEPWEEVAPKRRGGRPKGKDTVDLKAKTRCEGCGRQMCFHTLKFKHKCPNAPESAAVVETPAPPPDSGAGQLSCQPVPLVRQQTFTLRDQLMEIQRHQKARREAIHVGPIRQYYCM